MKRTVKYFERDGALCRVVADKHAAMALGGKR